MSVGRTRYLKKLLEAPVQVVHRKGVSGLIRIVRTKTMAVPAPTGRKLARFDSALLLSAPGVKAFKEVKGADGGVTDYRDVEIKGYLSTFGNTDRQGDTVKAGAFAEAIDAFMKNPRLLLDHRNSAEAVVGSFKVVREDNKGLYVEAGLSNSPSQTATDTRFKVAEGHLGALSMGGFFHYEQDGRTIFKVDLYEGSIVAIPANASALFSVRAVTDEEARMIGQR